MRGDGSGPKPTAPGPPHHKLRGDECDRKYHLVYRRAPGDGACTGRSRRNGWRRFCPGLEPWNVMAGAGRSDAAGRTACQCSEEFQSFLIQLAPGPRDFGRKAPSRLLKELSIAVVRGNLAEIASLVGLDANIRGVESLDSDGRFGYCSFDSLQKFGCVAALTGVVDVMTDGGRVMRVANGHPMMATVTGTGCMATSVVAACAAVEKDALSRDLAALAAYGLAGELAAEKGAGSRHISGAAVRCCSWPDRRCAPRGHAHRRVASSQFN